jgi:hypothetical protein
MQQLYAHAGLWDSNGLGDAYNAQLPLIRSPRQRAQVKTRFTDRLNSVSWRVVGQPEVGDVSQLKAIRIRLGYESLDVTLAYLKGKDAESEEAQEHANSSSLALYA